MKPTDFAKLFEERLEQDIEEARKEHERKQLEEGSKEKTFNENDIRKANLKKLHHLMKLCIEKRQHRLKLAQAEKTRQGNGTSSQQPWKKQTSNTISCVTSKWQR